MRTLNADDLAKMHSAAAAAHAERHAELEKLENIAKTLPPLAEAYVGPLQKKVRWSESECEAIWQNVLELQRRAPDIQLDKFAPYWRNYWSFQFVRLAAYHTVAPERRRDIKEFGKLPEALFKKVGPHFGIALAVEPEPAAPAAPAPIPVTAPPAKPVTWTDAEETSLLIHAAHILRQQNIRRIPMTTDHNGCMFFVDAMKLAQLDAFPTHRRKHMAHPREVLGGLGMLERLDRFLRMDHLPARPPRPPERRSPVDEAIDANRAKAVVNGSNGTHLHDASCNGRHEPQTTPPVAAPAETSPRELPVSEQKAAAGGSIAQLWGALGVELLHRMDSVDKLERRVKELEEYNELRLEEADSQAAKLKAAESQIAELREHLAQLRSADHKPKPRVAIVGCRRDEFEQVVAEAAKHGLDLTFKHYDQDAKPTRVFADWAISMKWVSHAWEDQIKASGIPRDQYTFLTGGMSMAIRQLEMWFAPAPV